MAMFTSGGPNEVIKVAGIPKPAMYAIRSCINPTLLSSDIPLEVNVQLLINLNPLNGEERKKKKTAYSKK